MTAIADLLTRADRQRLLERLAELGDLAGLPSVPEPVPLHCAGRDATIKERTAS